MLFFVQLNLKSYFYLFSESIISKEEFVMHFNYQHAVKIHIICLIGLCLFQYLLKKQMSKGIKLETGRQINSKSITSDFTLLFLHPSYHILLP